MSKPVRDKKILIQTALFVRTGEVEVSRIQRTYTNIKAANVECPKTSMEIGRNGHYWWRRQHFFSKVYCSSFRQPKDGIKCQFDNGTATLTAYRSKKGKAPLPSSQQSRYDNG